MCCSDYKGTVPSKSQVNFNQVASSIFFSILSHNAPKKIRWTDHLLYKAGHYINLYESTQDRNATNKASSLNTSSYFKVMIQSSKVTANLKPAIKQVINWHALDKHCTLLVFMVIIQFKWLLYVLFMYIFGFDLNGELSQKLPMWFVTWVALDFFSYFFF